MKFIYWPFPHILSLMLQYVTLKELIYTIAIKEQVLTLNCEAPIYARLVLCIIQLDQPMWHVEPFIGAGFLMKATSDKKGDCQATRPIDQKKNWPYQLHKLGLATRGNPSRFSLDSRKSLDDEKIRQGQIQETVVISDAQIISPKSDWKNNPCDYESIMQGSTVKH